MGFTKNEFRHKYLIETEELHKLLDKGSSDLRIVNSTWYMPNANRDPKKEHIESRIPTSIFFDIDEIADRETDLPHMLPPENEFKIHMRNLRIRKTDNIIFYDNHGIFSSPRAAWTLRFFGAENVRILNGGFKKWLLEGRPTESGKSTSDHLEEEGDYSYSI